MKKLYAVGVVALALNLLASSRASGQNNQSNANHAEDEAAIRKQFADVQDAWNRHDPKAMTAAAHLTEDYDHINVAGKWGASKVQAEKNMSDYFANTRVPSVEGTTLKLRFITPEVAICVRKLKYTRDQKTWEGITTVVLHKINGEWWNESFQNTIIGETKWEGDKLAVWAKVSAVEPHQ